MSKFYICFNMKDYMTWSCDLESLCIDNADMSLTDFDGLDRCGLISGKILTYSRMTNHIVINDKAYKYDDIVTVETTEIQE